MIWADRIFMPSPGAAGNVPEARVIKGGFGSRRAECEERLLLCFSNKDGKELWRITLDGD